MPVSLSFPVYQLRFLQLRPHLARGGRVRDECEREGLAEESECEPTGHEGA